jgi:hypothetical protein
MKTLTAGWRSSSRDCSCRRSGQTAGPRRAFRGESGGISRGHPPFDLRWTPQGLFIDVTKSNKLPFWAGGYTEYQVKWHHVDIVDAIPRYFLTPFFPKSSDPRCELFRMGICLCFSKKLDRKLNFIINQLEKIMSEQDDAAAALEAVAAQLTKATAEIIAAAQAQPALSPRLKAAIDVLKPISQALDDLNPDAPTPE